MFKNNLPLNYGILLFIKELNYWFIYCVCCWNIFNYTLYKIFATIYYLKFNKKRIKAGILKLVCHINNIICIVTKPQMFSWILIVCTFLMAAYKRVILRNFWRWRCFHLFNVFKDGVVILIFATVVNNE